MRSGKNRMVYAFAVTAATCTGIGVGHTFAGLPGAVAGGFLGFVGSLLVRGAILAVFGSGRRREKE